MMINNPALNNIPKAIMSVTKPSWVSKLGSPGIASQSKRSTEKNRAKAVNTNSNAILTIMVEGCFSDSYCKLNRM